MTNHVLTALAGDEPVFGAWVLSTSPRMAEVLAGSQLDWVGVDTEHAPVGPERVESLVRAVEPHEATPIVRLPSVEAAVAGGAKRALDAGAGGVIVPDVRTREDAERAVNAATFPPSGERGVAGTTRANGYGDRFEEYVATADDETLVVVQIESPEGVEHADEILAVEGVDVAFVGENDLSAAMGHPGEKDHPDVAAATDSVRAAAVGNEVVPGIGGRTPRTARERIDAGYRFFLLGADLTFARTGIEAFLGDV